MHLVILGVLVFCAIAYFGLVKRNSTVDKAKESLEDAKALKEAAEIEKEAKEILDSIDNK